MKKWSIGIAAALLLLACQREPGEGARYQVEDQNEIPENPVNSDTVRETPRDKTEVGDTVKYSPDGLPIKPETTL